MFKTVDELKQFIIWAKAEKIKSFKIDTIELTISDIGLIEDLASYQTKPVEVKPKPESEAQTDLKEEPKDDPDLFWSSVP